MRRHVNFEFVGLELLSLKVVEDVSCDVKWLSIRLFDDFAPHFLEGGALLFRQFSNIKTDFSLFIEHLEGRLFELFMLVRHGCVLFAERIFQIFHVLCVDVTRAGLLSRVRYS